MARKNSLLSRVLLIDDRRFFIRQDFYDELASVECEYSIKYLTCAFFAILSDTEPNMGDSFGYFPLFAARSFLAMRMKLRECA